MRNIISYQPPSGKPVVTLSDLKDAPIWVAWRENADGRKLPVNPCSPRRGRG